MPAVWLLALVWLLAPILEVGAQSLRPVPPLTARVIDQTGTLSAAQSAALQARLAALEAETGSQIAILLIDSTAPEALEAYALRVAEAWQLGRADIDDGALILVATADRRMRIEVGYGLEGAIPDARAKQIIAEIMQPRFREGDFAGGLEAAVDAMTNLVRGEDLPAPQIREQAPDLFALLPIILIVTVLLGGPLRSALGTLPGSLTAAAIAGGLVWLLVAVLGSALLAFAVTFFINLLGVAGPGSWSSGGGFGGGYGRGGFGGGRGGFGGGFGGGGGGFGGGGASGGW